MEHHLTGIIAATYTAMHADGSINLETIEQQAHHLTRNGVVGAFVCGTTGEGVSLTLDERRAIAERWVAVAKGTLSIIVHVGHNCLQDSKTLAKHAQAIGATAIAAMAPSFFKPTQIEDLVAVCAVIADSAPHLPFYYYHIPSMTGVILPVAAFLQAAAGISNLAGVKFTYEDLADLEQCLNTRFGNRAFNILFGRDELLLSALQCGVNGAVGSTYNFAAPLYYRIMELARTGHLAAAEKLQAQAVEFIRILNRYRGLPAGKAVMKMIGLDCGPVRLPLRNLAAEEYTALQTELERTGLFEYQVQR